MRDNFPHYLSEVLFGTGFFRIPFSIEWSLFFDLLFPSFLPESILNILPPIIYFLFKVFKEFLNLLNSLFATLKLLLL